MSAHVDTGQSPGTDAAKPIPPGKLHVAVAPNNQDGVQALITRVPPELVIRALLGSSHKRGYIVTLQGARGSMSLVLEDEQQLFEFNRFLEDILIAGASEVTSSLLGAARCLGNEIRLYKLCTERTDGHA